MLSLFSCLLKNTYKNKFFYFLIKKSYRHKYIWSFKKSKFFIIKPKLLYNPFIFNLSFKKPKNVNKIVKLKKLTGLFKRRLNFRSTLLKRRSFLFKKLNSLSALSLKKKHKFFIKYRKNKFNKYNFRKGFYRVFNINFHVNRRSVFYENRKIIRFFFSTNSIKKQNRLNSYLVNFLPKNSKNLLNFFEYKLDVVLIKSQFFNNILDSSFFIQKGFISVNSCTIFDKNYLVKIGDFIKINNKFKYYFFYKKSLNDSFYSLKKLNWSFYKFKKKRRKNKFFPKVYNWINYNIFFGFDVPYFFEVDYINMTLFIFFKPFNFNSMSYNNIKYLNFYLTRLYNWNYIN